jgi:hypothetical protein
LVKWGVNFNGRSSLSARWSILGIGYFFAATFLLRFRIAL